MNTPAPKVVRVIVGYYNVPGYGPDFVEVPCTGHGPADYATLAREIRKRHPKVVPGRIIRTGATIELRDPAEDPGYLDLTSGLTLRQLFDSPDGVAPSRSSLRIGKAFFDGAPVSVLLTFNRAAGKVGVVALPRLRSAGAVITFSNQVSCMFRVSGLETVVKELMGPNVRALELNTRRKPAPVPVPVPVPAPAPVPVVETKPTPKPKTTPKK
jgi:hypothetical protein